MDMTTIEVLRAAEPPADDGSIEQALTDLDVKIWTWTDAMLSAQTFLKRALTGREALGAATTASIARPQPVPQAATISIAPSLDAPAAPPLASAFDGGDWKPQVVTEVPAASEPAPAGWPAQNGWASSPAQPQPQPQQPPQLQAQPTQWGIPQPMNWPSNPGEWPAAAPSTAAAVEWPSMSWPSSEGANAAPPPVEEAPAKPKIKEKPVKTGPTDEELAARAAHEQEVLAALDETTARRVRLLRRLDPDAKIEQLVEKARQTSAEPADKNDKSSWWRRK